MSGGLMFPKGSSVQALIVGGRGAIGGAVAAHLEKFSKDHDLWSSCFFCVEISADLFLIYCSLEQFPDFHAVVRILQRSFQRNLRNHHCLESFFDSSSMSFLCPISESMPSYQVIFVLSFATELQDSWWIDNLTSIFTKNLTWYFDKHCPE